MGGYGQGDDHDPNVGVSRRQLIKRGAIVTGSAVWATPVIGSFVSPAAAQVGTPTGEGPCEVGSQQAQGYVKWGVGGNQFAAYNVLNPGTCLDPAGGCLAVSEFIADLLNVGLADGSVTVTGNTDEVTCVSVSGDTLVINAAKAKAGRSDCDDTPDAGSESTTFPMQTVCFRKEGAGYGVSHLELLVEACVPGDVLAQC